MTDRGSGRPLGLASSVGRLLLAAVVVIVILPFAMVWSAALSLLLAFRPLIVVVLTFATVGGAVAGGWLAYTGQWSDAAQAGISAGLSGIFLAGYIAIADRAGFDGSDSPSILPPWWWYL